MDDNTRNPKPKKEAKNQVTMLLNIVRQTAEQYRFKELVNILMGVKNATLSSHNVIHKDFFGQGKDENPSYWRALIRQLLVSKHLKKEIETYGVIKLTDFGKSFLASPSSYMMTENHDYETTSVSNSSGSYGKGSVFDKKLYNALIQLRKKVADKHKVPPYAVFQEPSIEDMLIKYPTTIDEMKNIHGVGDGKAQKFGKPFIELIQKYCEDNNVIRPQDIVFKSTGANSALKLYIIQNIDRKLPLSDIASAKGMDMSTFIKELETIMFSGTKLNIQYEIDNLFDEDQQEELYEYFMEAQTDDINAAFEEFDGDYEEEDLRLFRIRFMNEVAN